MFDRIEDGLWCFYIYIEFRYDWVDHTAKRITQIHYETLPIFWTYGFISLSEQNVNIPATLLLIIMFPLLEWPSGLGSKPQFPDTQQISASNGQLNSISAYFRGCSSAPQFWWLVMPHRFLVKLHPEGLALMHSDLRPEKDAGNHRQGTNKGRHLNKGKHDPPEYSEVAKLWLALV